MPALVGAPLAQTGSLVSFADNLTDFVSGEGGGSDLDKFTPNPSTRETKNPGHEKKQLLFIDPAVPNCESLISGTLQGVETVVLHPREEGVGQIAAGKSRSQRTAEYSHCIARQSGQHPAGQHKIERRHYHHLCKPVAAVAEALAADADILIYGCSVAQEAGSAFLEQLHRLTGANIAASATPHRQCGERG